MDTPWMWHAGFAFPALLFPSERDDEAILEDFKPLDRTSSDITTDSRSDDQKRHSASKRRSSCEASPPPTPRKRARRKEETHASKQILLNCPPPHVFKKMEDWIELEMAKLPPEREMDECWLHPCPPSYAQGSIDKTFAWTDQTSRQRHTAKLHFGVVTRFLAQLITSEQMQGLIHHGWHLSHLCGNWTCCNYNHFTIEPGHINATRNACLRKGNRGECRHDPRCLRERKLPASKLIISRQHGPFDKLLLRSLCWDFGASNRRQEPTGTIELDSVAPEVTGQSTGTAALATSNKEDDDSDHDDSEMESEGGSFDTSASESSDEPKPSLREAIDDEALVDLPDFDETAFHVARGAF